MKLVRHGGSIKARSFVNSPRLSCIKPDFSVDYFTNLTLYNKFYKLYPGSKLW